MLFLSINKESIAPLESKIHLPKTSVSVSGRGALSPAHENYSSDKAYSYEIYYEDVEPVIKKEPTQSSFQINRAEQPITYNHQPIEGIGTDLNNINHGLLPTEVLPGIEFINEESKVYFSGKNEGKYISVIPGQRPLLVRDEVKEVKNLNN